MDHPTSRGKRAKSSMHVHLEYFALVSRKRSHSQTGFTLNRLWLKEVVLLQDNCFIDAFDIVNYCW